MKSRYIIVSLFAFCLILISPRFSYSALSIEQCRNKAKTLHVGVLRKDISSEFEPDGGPTSRSKETLIVKGCREGDGRELRIDVQFELANIGLMNEKADSYNSMDKIKSISNSYLGYTQVK